MGKLVDRATEDRESPVTTSGDGATEPEPTLGAVMRALASRRPPRQLLEGVWVLTPWALYFASIGWWRAAVVVTALGSLGIWAVAHRWTRTTSVPWRRVAARALRAAAGTALAVLGGGLALELFLHLLGRSPIS